MDKGEDEEDINDNAFHIIEKEFKSDLQNLKANPNFSPFCVNYEKLFSALKTCYNDKKRLQEKIEDSSSIDTLKKDAKKAWTLVEAGRRKEDAISNTVTQLQDQLAKLSSQLEEERTNSLRQGDHYKDVIKEREDLKAKITQISRQIKDSEKSLKDVNSRNELLENKVEDLRVRNAKALADLSIADEQLKKENKNCSQVEKELIELKGSFERKTKEHIDLQYSAALSKNKIDQLNKDLHDANKNLENQVFSSNELCQRAQDLSDSSKVQKNKIAEMSSDLCVARTELELAKTSHRKIASEKSQLQRKFDNEHKTVLRLQQTIDDVKSTNLATQRELASLNRDLDKVTENESEILRQNSLLERERNMQIEKIHRTEILVKQADEDAMHQEHTVLSLEKDLAVANGHIERLNKKVYVLEQIIEKQSNDLSERRERLEKANNEVNIRGIEVQEMKKEINQWKLELKDHEQMSNRLRAERGKALRELEDEQKEHQNFKNQNGVLTSEIKRLRNELLSKDESLVNTYFDQKKQMTKKEQLNNEVSIFKRHIAERDKFIQKQDLEINRLSTTLKGMDEDALNQKKEFDQLINERDILSAQLIRRNDELALLYEKVKIQSNTLKKGEMQYKERLEDLRHLKIKLQDIQRELDFIKCGKVDSGAMAKELVQKQKELLHEKVKVKALSEELQNPLNLHRWRKLEGSDPATFELVQKNELLQKRLIKKTEEVRIILPYHISSNFRILFNLVLMQKSGQNLDLWISGD
jgi:chromosome segregation ATPase